MEIIRRVKNYNYTTISNEFLRDKDLSLKAKGLMCVIMGLPEGWDFSVKGLVAITREGKNAVYSAIKELIDAGYCVCRPIRGEGGKFGGNEYFFIENPDAGNPHPEEPHPGFPDTEKPDTENPPQLNKELINNLNNNYHHLHHTREEDFSDFGLPNASMSRRQNEEKEKGCAEKEKEAFSHQELTPYTPVRKLTIEECVKECLGSRWWMESVCMTHGILPTDVERIMKNFPSHLVATGNDGEKTLKDFKSHFNNYLRKIQSNGRDYSSKIAGRGVYGSPARKTAETRICKNEPDDPDRGKSIV